VWGPACASFGNYKYYASFFDDYSKFTWIYLLKNKSDVFAHFHDFQNYVERLFDRKILALQSNWGGEYHKLNTFFKRIGIEHHVSCPHAHQQNGSAERKHRHIVEMGLSLLAHAHMPLKYWDEAFMTATFLINRIPSRVTNLVSPLELLFKRKPDYTFLRTFGCACWPNLRPYNSRKLEFRSKRCVFLAIAVFTRDTSVLTSLMAGSIFPGMLFSMSMSSPSQNFIPMQVLVSVTKSCFFLLNWSLLHVLIKGEN
jgi:histone deacetylase 1/2